MLVLGVRTNVAHDTLALDDAALLAHAADGGADFHEGMGLGLWFPASLCFFFSGWNLYVEFRNDLVRSVAIHNASLFQVIGGHLDFHAVAGEDSNAMEAHAPGKMAKDLVVLCLIRQDADAESGIGKGLFYNANELNDCLTQCLIVEIQLKLTISPRILQM